MAIDLLDEEIIKLLAQNAKERNEVLAEKLKVTPGTVRRRIKKLITGGLIRIVAIVNPKKVGYPLAAVVAYHIETDKLDSAIKFLANIPEVVWVTSTIGQFDIISAIRFRSTDDLNKFISKVMPQVEGLRESETFMCLQEGKLKYSLMYTRDI